MLCINAGVANMAGAWFIHGRCGQCVVYTDRNLWYGKMYILFLVEGSPTNEPTLVIPVR